MRNLSCIISPHRGYAVAGPKRTDDGLTKAQRYREAQHRRGFKLLRVWVPDPHHPRFTAEAARQGRLLRGRTEEADALRFIDEAFSWPET